MADLNNFYYTDNVHDVLAVYVNRILAATLRSEYKNIETLNADRELTDADTPIQRIDCGGANRILKVPAIDAVNNHPFWIVNITATGTYTITLKSNDGATTHGIIPKNEAMFVLPDGNGGYLPLSMMYLLKSGLSDWDQQSSSPSNPATGKMKLFFKNDEKLYKRNPSGTETEISAGGGLTSGPEGFGDNYVITPSISSNNLVVALKTIAGTDASSSDKIPFRIGNTKRELTAALSLQVNAGGSVFNAGSNELAGKKIQLFVYIGWCAASSTIFLGLSRIPFGITYADFSATSIDEKYLAYTGSAPASTDVVEVIGRIDIQNSGTASYNWSLPSEANTINRPIYETDYLSWLPTASASVSMTFTSVTVSQAIYKIQRDSIFVSIDVNGTTGGTASYALQLTPPFKINTSKMPGLPYLPCYIIDSTKPGGYLRYAQSAFEGIQIERFDEANWGLGAGRYARGSLFYAT